MRAPRAAAEHAAVLWQSHERLRALVGGQDDPLAPSAWSDQRQDVCYEVYAVGINLQVQERPEGRLAGTWDQLHLAQRELQLACGELAMPGVSETGPPQQRLAPPRRAAATAHLARACGALRAIAADLGLSDRTPGC
ncbi:MAG: hypothetical protein HY690_20340 [Chloroflexi bacterium]|nr:hypothetical protein [Chloroflexota bacterium]